MRQLADRDLLKLRLGQFAPYLRARRPDLEEKIFVAVAVEFELCRVGRRARFNLAGLNTLHRAPVRALHQQQLVVITYEPLDSVPPGGQRLFADDEIEGHVDDERARRLRLSRERGAEYETDQYDCAQCLLFHHEPPWVNRVIIFRSR